MRILRHRLENLSDLNFQIEFKNLSQENIVRTFFLC